jgi:hypothetical protein
MMAETIFGRSSQPKRQPVEFEDRVRELMAGGFTQDEALDIAEGFRSGDGVWQAEVADAACAEFDAGVV